MNEILGKDTTKDCSAMALPKRSSVLDSNFSHPSTWKISKNIGTYRLHTLLAETLGKIIIQKNCLKNSKKFEMYFNQLINQIAIYIF